MPTTHRNNDIHASDVILRLSDDIGVVVCSHTPRTCARPRNNKDVREKQTEATRQPSSSAETPLRLRLRGFVCPSPSESGSPDIRCNHHSPDRRILDMTHVATAKLVMGSFRKTQTGQYQSINQKLRRCTENCRFPQPLEDHIRLDISRMCHYPRQDAVLSLTCTARAVRIEAKQVSGSLK